MSLSKPHSFYFSTETNTTNRILLTVYDNIELPNFDRTHTQTTYCTNKKENAVSKNARALCSGTARIFRILKGNMHRTNQFSLMMKPTSMQVT
jgi:glutaredoxin 2